MRGLAIGVLVLTGIYLVTTTGAGRLSTALAVPTGWLAKWADPTVPLIPAKASTAAASTTSAALAPHPRSGPARPSPGHDVNRKAA